MDQGGHKDAAHIHTLMIEYLEWAGMDQVGQLLKSECQARGLAFSREDLDSRSSSRASRADSEAAEANSAVDDLLKDLLASYDTGQGAKFFQTWRTARERTSTSSSSTLEALTLEFYLHVYFATLPLRHGHKEDHPVAMAVFRRFLETCSPRVGTVQDLLPFYALPYVPDPTHHPAFRPVFQEAWVRELRGRLSGFLGRRTTTTTTSRPAIFSYLHHHRHHSSSVGAALVAQESAASAVRSQRVLRRRLQRLQEDYHKLIGVSWELTQALEAAVRGERVDLEGTLAACTHRYPELFTLTLTADTKAGPATILLESMQQCRRRPGVSAPVPALDFQSVRADLAAAPETHVLLLLQALRHRVTRVTAGSVRQAVVTAYVRGDVLGLRGSSRSWGRLAGALMNPESQLLAQSAARLINALTAFNAGRSYLASEEVCEVLLQALHVGHLDATTTDMALAALQKLSIRGVVQGALIEGGAVEWLVNTLAEVRTLTPYTQEYASALFMNLTLRSAGRARCHPLAAKLLPALIQLLTSVQTHVVPYVTGALYSLLSHSSLRQEAFTMGLDSTLERLAQGGSTEQRRQLEYIVEQIRRDPPLSPPPSPDPVLDVEEDPEWLEEELDVDDPVRAPPHAPSGEDLLAWRYTLHPGETEESGRRSDIPPARSAPVIPWDPGRGHSTDQRTHNNNPRPNSDGFVTQMQHRLPQQQHLQQQQQQQKQQHQQHQQQQQQHGASGQWDYPSDSDAGHSTMHTSKSKALEMGRGKDGDDGGEGGAENYREVWGESQEVELSLPLHGAATTPPRPHSPHDFVPPDQHNLARGENSEGRESPTLLSPSATCPAEALVPYFTRQPHHHDPHHYLKNSSGTSNMSPALVNENGDEDMTIVSSRSTSDPPAEEQQQPHSLGNTTFRIGSNVHDKIIEEEEKVLNAARVTHSPPARVTQSPPARVAHSPPARDIDVGEDFQFSNIVTAASDDGPTMDLSGESVDPENETTEAERKVAVEEPQESPVEKEDGKKSHQDVKRILLPAAASPPPPPKPGTRDTGYDLIATRIMQQIVGENRDIPAPSTVPEADPLLRSLPPPKASEYKVAFSSRPRIARTPPGSAAVDKGPQGTPGTSGVSPGSLGVSSSSPRHVLPPISRTNHTYTRAAT
ncbi:lisH domain-containing protein ARMC9-like isoform X3 [Cherax quadricarinatus]|uniref:lisH domain-containing protein ARMC9-like isoform X3 n=1 Tax=Cherax quadricarinatus TaxID=27406 RepID=UPI00387E9220